MTNRTRAIAATGIVLALALGVATVARAQGSAVSAALAEGTVGEQADGYLGFRGSPSAAVRAAVEDINIQRRAAYTDLAARRGVSVSDMAAATGCRTLATKVGPGRAYFVNGSWGVREGGAPVPTPSYCPSVG